MNQNGNVPMLGQQKPKAGIQTIGVLARQLDENGMYEPEAVVMGPGGQPVAIPGRGNFLSAEDLIREIVEEVVDALRPVIREELAAALDTKLDSASKR